MTHPSSRLVVPVTLLLAACGPAPGFEAVSCADMAAASCTEVAVEDAGTLLEVINGLGDDSAVVLGAGTFTMTNAVVIRSADQVTLIGQGIDETILEFGGLQAQAPAGVDIIADDLRVEGFTIQNTPKDGLRIEDSDGVIIRALKATWTNGPDTANGAYGLYPVKVSRVLMEDSEAYNASDAGIYVGQCVNAIVRNNIAKANVAGLEIENTQFADVYGNLTEDNTGGLVVFDLPGNPVIGRDIRIHDNTVVGNNRPNFAPGGTVRQIPAGTGTFAMASRRVEITGNTYADNDTFDLAVVSGLVIDSDEASWMLPKDELVGDVSGLDLPEDDTGDSLFNYRTYDIWIHGNSHAGSGTDPDMALVDGEPGLGFLIGAAYGDTPVDTVLYDSIGESGFSATEASENTNDNHICVGVEPGLSVASLDIENLSEGLPNISQVYRPEAPFTPFDCEGFANGPIIAPDLGDIDTTPSE